MALGSTTTSIYIYVSLVALRGVVQPDYICVYVTTPYQRDVQLPIDNRYMYFGCRWEKRNLQK